MGGENEVGRVKASLREIRLRVAACIALICLSVDDLNPVKVVCSILQLDTNWVALVTLGWVLTLIYANANDLIYFSVKIFLQSIGSIFFSSIEVVGRQNIPEHGPIIFSGNHMNQFVDGMNLLCTSPHQVGFLVASHSFKKPVIGHMARATRCFPVTRPQDFAKKGTGKIKVIGMKVLGEGTSFTKLENGDKVRIGAAKEAYKLRDIVSDTEASMWNDEKQSCDITQDTWLTYDVFQFVDQSKMFEKVNDALAKGNNLGIFPEGGSHDRTDLLPLKVGVSVIAFGTLERHDINVPIVPVGLNYFRGHRFRGRVVIEYGEPIRIDKELFAEYKKDKRKAYNTLLARVEEGMRGVIVTAPDYDTLKLVHTARRLYSRHPSNSTSTKIKQDLARRFSIGYRMISEKFGEQEDLRKLEASMEKYQDTLDAWALKDYQVNHLEVPYSKTLYTFLHGCGVLAIASVPSIILNAPVGIVASWWARTEAKKDLAKSRVKIEARDVLLSKKIVFSIMAVPTLWITYAVLLYIFSGWETRTILVMLLSCPLFSYLGVMSVQAGMVDVKDLRPVFLRLLPQFREIVHKLPTQRAELQAELRAIVKKYGPELGPLYYDDEVDWNMYVRKKEDVLLEGNEYDVNGEKEDKDKDQ